MHKDYILDLWVTNRKFADVKIDLEYKGHEATITALLLRMLADEKRMPDIHFGRIGKKSMAHYRASLVASGKVRDQTVIVLEELMWEIKKTEVGKRLKNV